MNLDSVRELFPDFDSAAYTYQRSAAIYSAAIRLEEAAFYEAVYAALGQGYSAAECARTLGVSEKIVRQQMKELSKAKGILMPKEWEGPESVYSTLETLAESTSYDPPQHSEEN